MAVKVARPRLTRIGDYEVLEPLAEAELSTTYKARHTATGDVVAVKLASPRVVQDRVLTKRFSQEYTLMRGLDHPHLVRALHFGHEGKQPYIVLEYVAAQNLGELIEQKWRLPEAEAVRILSQVAEALQYAHQHRIIHRNVKPANVLLTADGTAKLADLGLAKDYDGDTDLTRQSSGLGTPHFMAPEQFTDAKNADRRCDVYSLAATLYVAVTGALPFDGRDLFAILEKKRQNALVRPRQLVPALSAALEAALLRALDANPRVRHSSCLRFMEDLKGQTAAPAAPAAPSTPGRSERRATVRFASKQDGVCQPLQSKKGGTWDAAIRDVSADGIALVLGRRFERRTTLLLELNDAQGKPPRRLLVRVVRINSLPAGRWLLGCDFGIRLSEEEVKALL